jgi:ribosomal protein S12 methylthiotransferase
LKTKTLKKNKINVVTLGCSKNIYDSEVLLGQLKANNLEAVHESTKEDFNIVVINTCGFIENAKQESIDTILQYVDAKQQGLVDKVYVTGCLSERYKPDLEKEIPDVDAYFGTRELPRLLKTLRADYKHELIGERLLTTPAHFAYFKISEGCDRPCSFCAIPLMRGKHISTPMEQLVNNAQNLARQGTRELLLIAQDSTYYGLDIYKERKLAELMNQLSEVDGIDWIRLHYAFPSGFPEDVIEVIASNPKVCKYIDMPLQHISNPLLKSMKRGTTREKTYALLNKLRTGVPGIAIRTTLITGYPGETDSDHQEMIQFIKDIKFDRLGVFTYSHEENTSAFELNDNLSAELKQERAAELMEIQQGISYELNQEKVGKTFKVLFDKAENGYFIGRTEYDSPEVDNEVMVEAKNNFIRLGDFAHIKIESAQEFDLFGNVIDIN